MDDDDDGAGHSIPGRLIALEGREEGKRRRNGINTLRFRGVAGAGGGENALQLPPPPPPLRRLLQVVLD